LDQPHLLNAGPPSPAGAQDPAPAPWGVREVVAALFVVLGAALVLGVLFIGAARVLPIDDPRTQATGAAALVVGALVQDLILVGVAASFSLRAYHVGPRAWGLRRERPLALGACAGVLVASFLVLVVYQAVVMALGIEDLEAKENVPEGLLDHRAVLPFAALFIVAAAPVAEEIFFRGFLFNGLRRRLTTPGAAAVSGTLFGATHIVGGPLGVLIPFAVIGFLFAMLVARTGSLWNSILVHAAFNLFSLTAGLTAELTGAEVGLPLGAVAVLALFLAARLVARRWGTLAVERGVP
jgi:membrane protease YdiL (CAAX protease family)